jgi:hypothetical protein
MKQSFFCTIMNVIYVHDSYFVQLKGYVVRMSQERSTIIKLVM